MTYCRDGQPGRRKKEAKEQTKRQFTGSKTPQLSVQGGERRAKKDGELYIQGVYKEVEEARLHDKPHLVCGTITWTAARCAPQIRVIKDGKGIY